MWDLSGVFYRNTRNTVLNNKNNWEMIDALTDAVPYCVRGSGRAAARGLSFCYAADFLPSELDIYAKNCPSANYLSLLDAISPWTAPDWVYQKVGRLPEMDMFDAYQVKVNRVITEDGIPGFYLDEGSEINVGTVRFNLYRKNEATGRTVMLGTAPAYYDTTIQPRGVYRVPGLGLWPAIDGEFCEIEALSIPMDGDYDTLYSVPIRINNEDWELRCAYQAFDDSYIVYGFWEGFDSDSAMFNRNVMDISRMGGREYSLRYNVDGIESFCEVGETKVLPRKLVMEKAPLPAGTYYMEYVIYDIFMRPLEQERVELYWDGHKMSISNGTWEGKETLNISNYYKSEMG